MLRHREEKSLGYRHGTNTGTVHTPTPPNACPQGRVSFQHVKYVAPAPAHVAFNHGPTVHPFSPPSCPRPHLQPPVHLPCRPHHPCTHVLPSLAYTPPSSPRPHLQPSVHLPRHSHGGISLGQLQLGGEGGLRPAQQASKHLALRVPGQQGEKKSVRAGRLHGTMGMGTGACQRYPGRRSVGLVQPSVSQRPEVQMASSTATTHCVWYR